MFHTKQPSPTQHFPYEYELPASMQVSSPTRGGKWLIEILIAGVIVILLLVGGVLIYNRIRAAKSPAPTASTTVQQSPQANQQKKPTNAPAAMSQSGATNSGVINRPSGQ